MAGQLSRSARGLPSQSTQRTEMGADKTVRLRPAEELGCLGAAGTLSVWVALILWFFSVNNTTCLMEHVRLLQDLWAGPVVCLDSCQPLGAQRAPKSSMWCCRLQSKKRNWGECRLISQQKTYLRDQKSVFGCSLKFTWDSYFLV